MNLTYLFSDIATVGILWAALCAVLKSKNNKSIVLHLLVYAIALSAILRIKELYPLPIETLKIMIGVPLTSVMVTILVMQIKENQNSDAFITLISSVPCVFSVAGHFGKIFIVLYAIALFGLYICVNPLVLKKGKGNGRQKHDN